MRLKRSKRLADDKQRFPQWAELLQEGWTGTICDEVWVVPDECLEGTYIVSADNATSSCEAPRCRPINDETAYCYECSVCGEGFTHVADCVPERNNSRDGSDTVCVRE